MWRAGELRLKEAEELLLRLIGTGDDMLDYSIVWSLGQLGGEKSIEALRQIESSGAAGTVRRLSSVALTELTSGPDRYQITEMCCEHLPEELRATSINGPAEAFTEALTTFLDGGNHLDYEVLDILYVMNTDHVRPALLELIRTARLEPHFFQRFRHIYKAAELRRDADFLGAITHRIATTRATFRMPDEWSLRYYHGGKKPTIGESPKQAFSNLTRDHMRRRGWRLLK